jgi:hypothetical protein
MAHVSIVGNGNMGRAISIDTSTPTIDDGVRQEPKDFPGRTFASGSASTPFRTVECRGEQSCTRRRRQP